MSQAPQDGYVRILSAPANIATAIGANYTLWDDDAGSVPPFQMVGFDKPPVNLPAPPDTSLMPIVYAGVYVLPVLADPSTYQPNSPFEFQVRTTGAARTTGNENSQVKSGPEFWAVHITSAFQGYVDKDSDPDAEEADPGLQYGFTVHSLTLGGWKASGSLIYMETIRDKTRANPNSMQTLERYTLVHESGHQFLLDHPDGRWPDPNDTNPADDFIMTDVTNPSGMAPNVAFSPTSRSKIREIEHPPLEEP